MEKFIAFHTDLFKTAPLLCLGFGVIEFLVCVVAPALGIYAALRGLGINFRVLTSANPRETYHEEVTKEYRSGLESPSGRLLCLLLGISFLGAAAVMWNNGKPGSENIILLTAGLGLAALAAALFPSIAADILDLLPHRFYRR